MPILNSGMGNRWIDASFLFREVDITLVRASKASSGSLLRATEEGRARRRYFEFDILSKVTLVVGGLFEGRYESLGGWVQSGLVGGVSSWLGGRVLLSAGRNDSAGLAPGYAWMVTRVICRVAIGNRSVMAAVVGVRTSQRTRKR